MNKFFKGTGETEQDMATNAKGENVTKTISLDPQLHEAIMDRIRRLNLKGLSHYFQVLSQMDLKERGPIVLEEEETGSNGGAHSKLLTSAAKSRKAKPRK